MILLLPSSGSLSADSTRSSFFRASLLMWLGEEVALEVAADYDEMTTRIRAGEVALAWAPPVVCAQVETHVRSIYKSIRDGHAHYQAALLVRRGSVASLGELEGRRAAWVDPLSSGGYLLAHKFLRAALPELQLAEQRFTGTYKAALTEVLEDRADVTSVYAHSAQETDALKVAQDIVGSAARELTVLRFTPATPNDGLVLTRALSDDQCRSFVRRIQQAPPATLLQALQIEGLTEASPDAYRALR